MPKLEAAFKLAWINIGGLVWGHGEKPFRLLLSAVFFLLVLSAANFWSAMPRVGWVESGSGLKLTEYVVQLFLDMSPNLQFRGFEIVDYLTVLLRYVYIGLFISVLYKSISHR